MSEYSRNSVHRHAGNFWNSDLSGHKKKSYFAASSPAKKWALSLLFLFVIVWCFFSGYVISNALLPDLNGYIVTSDDLINSYVPVTPDDNDEDDDPVVVPPPVVTGEGVRVILLIGCDERDADIGRSDTIMLAFLDEATNEMKLLSIPRDTYVQIAGSSTVTKINHAYAYGGVTMTRTTIENVLGIEIDNYIKVNFQGFVALVDAVGGVEIDVPFDMENASENIHLKKGLQTLNGEEALGFVRYREPLYADIGRVERQQYFLTELANQVLVFGNVTKIPTFISIATKNITTDFSTAELLRLANNAFDMDLSTLECYVIPGDGRYINNVSYYIADEDATAQMLAEIMNVEETEVALNFPDASHSTELPSYVGGNETPMMKISRIMCPTMKILTPTARLLTPTVKLLTPTAAPLTPTAVRPIRTVALPIPTAVLPIPTVVRPILMAVRPIRTAALLIPTVVRTNPDGGTTNPDGGTTNPDGGTTNPDGGTTNPDGGTTNPDGGTTNPDGGTTNPDGGTTNPDGGTTNPDSGTTNPDGGTTNPDGGTTNPDGGTTNPDGGTTNPDGGTTNPDGGTTNPDGGTTNPDEPIEVLPPAETGPAENN